MALQSERNELRRRFLEIRRRISVENASIQRNLCAHLLDWLERQNSLSVGFYWPVGSEPDLRDMILKWSSQNQSRVATIPIVDDIDEGLMHYGVWKENFPMRKGAFGIAVPVEDIPFMPDVILAPCVAFNKAGYRLGNGGGFYDRYLAKNRERGITTVAVGYDGLESLEFICADYDVAFDFIATETGVRERQK